MAGEYFDVSRQATIPGDFIAATGGEFPGGNGNAVFAVKGSSTGNQTGTTPVTATVYVRPQFLPKCRLPGSSAPEYRMFSTRKRTPLKPAHAASKRPVKVIIAVYCQPYPVNRMLLIVCWLTWRVAGAGLAAMISQSSVLRHLGTTQLAGVRHADHATLTQSCYLN